MASSWLRRFAALIVAVPLVGACSDTDPPSSIAATTAASSPASSVPSAGDQPAGRRSGDDYGSLLSAAFAELAGSPTAYAELHHRYLGVTQAAPDPSTCAPWPAAAPQAGTVKLGYVAEEPLHTVDPAGNHRGFEADLAGELIERANAHYRTTRLRIEWVLVDVELPIGPGKNPTEFEALAAGLRRGDFDVAFSSVVPLPDPGIDYLCPMMGMFPGVVYTGRDDLDVSAITDRASLVQFLVAHPGMTFAHGMGQSVYDALAGDVALAGGLVLLAAGGEQPHFRMADIIGLSKAPPDGTRRVLLDVNPRIDFQPRSTFTLAS